MFFLNFRETFKIMNRQKSYVVKNGKIEIFDSDLQVCFYKLLRNSLVKLKYEQSFCPLLVCIKGDTPEGIAELFHELSPQKFFGSFIICGLSKIVCG